MPGEAALRDALVLLPAVAAGFAFAWWSGCPWFVTNFLVLGFPLTWLWLGSEKVRRGLDLRFAVLLALFGAVVFDSLARRTGAWGGPSLLPLLPGDISLEELQWILLFFPLCLAVNERFFASTEYGRPVAAAPYYLVGGFFAGLAVAVHPATPALLGPFSYWKIGSVLFLPAIAAALAIRRGVLRELLGTLAVTAPFHLAFEVVALRNGYWTFPGSYLGWVSVGGHAFPVEELVFLVLLSGPSLVAIHSVYKSWRVSPLCVNATQR